MHLLGGTEGGRQGAEGRALSRTEGPSGPGARGDGGGGGPRGVEGVGPVALGDGQWGGGGAQGWAERWRVSGREGGGGSSGRGRGRGRRRSTHSGWVQGQRMGTTPIQTGNNSEEEIWHKENRAHNTDT